MTVDEMRLRFLPVVQLAVQEMGVATLLPHTLIFCHRSNREMYKHLRKNGGEVREDYVFEVGDRARVETLALGFPRDMIAVLLLASDGQCLLPFNTATQNFAVEDELEPDYMVAILEAVRSSCRKVDAFTALEGPDAPAFFFGHEAWGEFCNTLLGQGGDAVGPLVIKVHPRELFTSLGTAPRDFRADLVPVVIGHPNGVLEARGFDPRTNDWGVTEVVSGTVH